MKTAEKNGSVQGTQAKANEAASQSTNRVENRPSLTGKEAKENEAAAQAAPAEVTETAEGQVGSAAIVDNPSTDNGAAPAKAEVKGEAQAEAAPAGAAKAEEAKPELQPQPVKFALNLEQTLKSVGDLHRLSIQRLALMGRIKTLEDFEVKLQEENDELESNPYQGCKLIIRDDRGREFITNTPNLIRMVSQFIFDACHEKLADIEANIVFPTAW